MSLYHITITSSKGLIHKIGITRNMKNRLQQYKMTIPHEDIELIKERQFNSIDEAYIVEQEICKQFEAVGGKEYFLLSNTDLSKFNKLFYGIATQEIESEINCIPNDQLLELHESIKVLYINCYENLHRLQGIHNEIISKLDKKIRLTTAEPKIKKKYVYPKEVIEPVLGEDLVKMVDAGRRYSREEFKVLIQAWIDKHDLSKKYKSLNVDSKMLISTVNRFLASIGKCWECIQSRNQGERDRFYTLTNLMPSLSDVPDSYDFKCVNHMKDRKMKVNKTD